MFLSTRETFTKDSPYWARFIKFSGLTHLPEVRTIDAALNPLVEDGCDLRVSPQAFAASAKALRSLAEGRYHLLAINLQEEENFVPAGWNLLGHDLTDETQTSSLLNCGPWKGQLEPLVKRQNQFGLLSRSDAELAQKLLPLEWSAADPHAHVVIWALYEQEKDC